MYCSYIFLKNCFKVNSAIFSCEESIFLATSRVCVVAHPAQSHERSGIESTHPLLVAS